MPRKKKVDVVEEVTPMKEDAMNPPVEDTKEPVIKQVDCMATKVNVRQSPNGDVLYAIPNHSKVVVEEEKDGWCKVTGYIMSELIK